MARNRRHGVSLIEAMVAMAILALVLGADAHLRAAHVAGGARAALARVAIRRLLPQHAAHLAEAREGAAGLYALSPEDLAA